MPIVQPGKRPARRLQRSKVFGGKMAGGRKNTNAELNVVPMVDMMTMLVILVGEGQARVPQLLRTLGRTPELPPSCQPGLPDRSAQRLLQSGGETAFGASAGAPKPLDLAVPMAGADPQKSTLEAYTKNIAAINKMIEEATKRVKVGAVEQLLPGGSIKVAAASAGSVSLVETFKRPLVIGYLGFDVPIWSDGVLGPPIPTRALWNRR